MPLSDDKTSTIPQAHRLRNGEVVAVIARMHRNAIMITADNNGREAVKNPVPRIRGNPRTRAINQPESEKTGTSGKPFSGRILRAIRKPRLEDPKKIV